MSAEGSVEAEAGLATEGTGLVMSTVGIPDEGTALSTEASGLSSPRGGLDEAGADGEDVEVEVAEVAPRGVDLGGRARLRLTCSREGISM